ncbi:hypothetical protein [Flavobacterium sp.]|jgi:hypothetical protein|uniref:hypothetical protein n=1 Tax=Flavobacterium sp. TaxID=239 RepID=UPI0037BFCD62
MFKKISIVALATVLFASCDPSSNTTSNCPVIIGVPTTLVTGPTTTAVNVPINLEVSYKAKANCGDFTTFFKEFTSDPLIELITVNNSYDSCSCDEVETVQKRIYIFQKTVPGVYILKFKDSNTTTIDHTVTVQ